MRIGIIVAMSKEYELLQGIEFPQHEIKIVRSGIGKVNAAISAIELINDFNPDLVINSGVAGGIDSCLSVADLVIGTQTCYHDFYAGEVSDHLKELGFEKFISGDARVID
ncbi:MAG: 5'-methylthioadenosine/S-adenosylhomocysteine nucleosidase, partial [Paludibacteraceae bacterium]|nr:5'-methylthioadenosine/S-adenosylhomocysteine nucleosidase [Paludibacteraceae bacterium]